MNGGKHKGCMATEGSHPHPPGYEPHALTT